MHLQFKIKGLQKLEGFTDLTQPNYESNFSGFFRNLDSMARAIQKKEPDVTICDLLKKAEKIYCQHNNFAMVQLESELDRSAQFFGLSLYGLGQSEQFSNSSFKSIRNGLMSVLALKQAKVFSVDNSRPSGFLGWGWISSFTISKLSSNPGSQMHVSEFNEGSHLFLRFLAFNSTSRIAVAEEIERLLLVSERELTFVGKTKGSSQHQLFTIRGIECVNFTEWIRGRDNAIR